MVCVCRYERLKTSHGQPDVYVWWCVLWCVCVGMRGLTASPNNSIILREAVYFSCDPWLWRLLEKRVSVSDWREKQS